MKKSIIIVSVIFLVFSAFITKRNFITSIYGTIEPAEGASLVWAVNNKDSVSVVPESGKFSIAVAKAGKYKVLVKAVKPFKDMVLENITVEDGKSTNAGVISLSRE